MKIKKIFEIELDEPSPHWLDAQTVYDALSDAFGHAEEKAVKYNVIELARYPDYDGQRIEHTNCASITKEDRELLEKLNIPFGEERDRPLDMICRDIEHKAFDSRVRALEEKGYEYIPKEGWKNAAEILKKKNLHRFRKELGTYPTTVGIGMCAGCGKVRGSTSIYSGVPCEECGYKPERLTQESINKGETK